MKNKLLLAVIASQSLVMLGLIYFLWGKDNNDFFINENFLFLLVIFSLVSFLLGLTFHSRVQNNFDDLCKHSIVRHVCRAIDKFPSHAPDIYQWIHVLEFVRHIGIKPYSLHGNLHSMNSKSEWPKFLTVFADGFPDKSVPIQERFLQLVSIYHPFWRKIWTLTGWRMNRLETAWVEHFLYEFPKPFYQRHFVEELFHIIV